jgi:hypothetical protein
VISVTLPWVGSSINVHANGNWRAKANATKTNRRVAFLIASSVRGSLPIDKAIINYTFFVPDKRKRDEANMIQACKPYVDGVVDARVIAGDDWERLSTGKVTVVVDRENPRIVLEFAQVA